MDDQERMNKRWEVENDLTVVNVQYHYESDSPNLVAIALGIRAAVRVLLLIEEHLNRVFNDAEGVDE